MKTIINPCLLFLAWVIIQGCSFTTAHIRDVKMCNEFINDGCTNDNPSFSASDPVFIVSCIVANAPSETKITFSWFYTTGERIAIDEASVTLSEGGTYPVHSSLSAPADGWPKGDYEVVISIEGFENKTVTKPFTVK